MKKYKIHGIFTGTPKLLESGLKTSMIKSPQNILKIQKYQILNDEVAATKYHGGDMRVVHHYSKINYDFLKSKFPELSERFIPGSFGENIYTEELCENDLNIGDIYQLGSAKVQLTVPRRPCATINAVYSDNRVLKAVLDSGRSGWFYRVLEEGEVKAGDYLEFLDSPYPNLPLNKLFEQGYGKNRFSDQIYLKRCLDTGLMDKGWLPKIEQLFS